MRYAALNQGTDDLASYVGFVPTARDYWTLPAPETQTRYSDEQLYALALYVYSLEPPPNPNKPSAISREGERVFQREGCARCHTPPLYTSNKLTPAIGFTLPKDPARDDVSPTSVGTDPSLAMTTRRGTGFYKVPSLRDVWYRSMFGHEGQCAALEDWFDPARLHSDYEATGFHLSRGPVSGHPFGLELSSHDRAALIAFLRTL